MRRSTRLDRMRNAALRSVVAGCLAVVGLVLVPLPAHAATPVHYSATCSNSGWFVKVTIKGPSTNTYKVIIEPHGKSRISGYFSSMWSDLWACINPPKGLTSTISTSLKQQLQCHAMFSAPVIGGWNTGPTWDLESDRTTQSNTVKQAYYSCNWPTSPYYGQASPGS